LRIEQKKKEIDENFRKQKRNSTPIILEGRCGLRRSGNDEFDIATAPLPELSFDSNVMM